MGFFAAWIVVLVRKLQSIVVENQALRRSAETLLIESSESEPEPTNYWLATVDEDIIFPRSGGPRENALLE